jgi:ligand-binding sensor domain-containing protein
MIAKTQTIFSIAALMVIFSCKPNDKKTTLSFTPEILEARGDVVLTDSLPEPKVTPAGKPTIIRIGTPQVVPTNTNIHPAGTPRIVIAGVPRVCTPGQDTFSIPKKVAAIENPIAAGIPEVVIAKEAFTKDQNPENFSSFGKQQGLKSAIIHCLLEDKSGNLWIGAYDGGLCKYDGKSFTHFTTKEGLSFNTIDNIFQDSRGNLWLCSGGLTRYDGKSFTRFTTKEGLSSNWVSSILEDKNGHLWIGTNGGGVNRYDGKSFTHFTVKEGLCHNTVSSIVEDKKGHLWFGTHGGVSEYDGKSFTNFTVKEGLGNNLVYKILEDKSGNLWFGTSDGVIKYDRKSFSHFSNKEGLVNHGISGMAQDSSGNLWIGTWNGVYKYDPDEGSFTHFTENEGLSSNEVRSVLVDKRGNLWLGTKAGINKYGGKRFTHYTVKEGLGDNRVMSIEEDTNGNLWFGTYAGVSKYDGKSFTNFSRKEGIDYVWNMLKDKSGNLWFASFWGLGLYDGKSFIKYANAEIDVKASFEDKNGNLWFGTHLGGVNKFDGKSFTHFTEKEGLSNNAVRGIAEDNNGNLWFATLNGLSKFNPADNNKNFTNFNNQGGLRDNKVVSILKDREGNLWIGSFDGGVSRYDGKNFIHFTEKEGLTNNNVRNILQDKEGNLWFGTAFGLNKLDKDKLTSLSSRRVGGAANKGVSGESEPLFKTYTYEDGFAGFNVNWGKTLYEARDGTIWVAAEDRLTAYHPEDDIPDTIPPDIQLTGLSLFNDNIPWQNLGKESDSNIVLSNGVPLHDFRFDSVSKWYDIPQRLSLAHNNNYLTFQFVGTTIQSPKKVKYQYMLEGLEDNWSALTNRTEASYGNLPHGHYTFKVKAVNVDGYWSNEYHYSVTIRPPWWQTWWAYTLFVLLSAGIIYSLFRYRLNKIRIQHQLAVQQHKVTELEMQTLRAQMNPHFIFNSLNSINLFILENNKLQASEYLTKFSRLVRLILNNSQEAFIPLEQDLEALELYLELESLRFEQKFSYKIEVDQGIDTSVLKVPPLIIQPYAENAIWHGLMNKKDKGHLEISVYQQKNNLFCKIIDDGIGRKRAIELKSRSSSPRKSVGMHITAQRIAMFQDQGESKTYVSVTDLVLPDGSAGGTEVLITIPFRV